MKIGIVNDLPMAVEALRRALMQAPQHQVIWVARDGIEAVEQCARETPDLVLMDLLMPRMDGIEATRRIMAATPCAILVVTVSVGANAWRVFEAMGCGALDAVDTPQLGSGDPVASAAPLLAKIAVIGRLIGDPSATPRSASRAGGAAHGPHEITLVAIGASAGGPAALVKLLSALPRDLPAGIVVIQHVDEQFASGMAQWLGQHSALPVRVAREGDRVAVGEVLLAGTNDHLVFKSAERLGYVAEPADYAYRPSVDVFFQSVTRHWPGEVVGVLLTGMGRDGAAGLKALRSEGHHTIAQDQASCAVYGMPKAAAAIGAAAEILPLESIAPKLADVLRKK